MPTDFSFPRAHTTQITVFCLCLLLLVGRDRLLWFGLLCLASVALISFDFSFAYKLFLSVAVLILFFIVRQWIDFFFILTATSLVLMAELFNSAIEAFCDFIETRENPKIKVIKDHFSFGRRHLYLAVGDDHSS